MTKKQPRCKIWGLALIGLGLACFAGTPAAVSAPTLLAPVYPGAVRDDAGTQMFVEKWAVGEDRKDYKYEDKPKMKREVYGEQYEVYLSNDPWQKVREFYDKSLGGALLDFNKSYDNHFTIPCDERANICYGKVLMESSKVAGVFIDKGHVMVDAYHAGVLVEARKPPAAQQAQPDQTDAAASATATAGQPAPNSQAAQEMAALSAFEKQVAAAQQQMTSQVQAEEQENGIPDSPEMQQMSDLFEGLKNEVMITKRHSQAELMRVYAQYKHLDTAEYPSVRLPDGDVVSYDRWLLKKDKQEFNRKPTPEEMQAIRQKMARLEDEGKSEEAGKLFYGPDHWSDWIGFLKQLDAHAYRTRIIVYVDPRSWKPEKGGSDESN